MTEVLEEEAEVAMEQSIEVELVDLIDLVVRLRKLEVHCPVSGLYLLMLDHVGQEPVSHQSLGSARY